MSEYTMSQFANKKDMALAIATDTLKFIYKSNKDFGGVDSQELCEIIAEALMQIDSLHLETKKTQLLGSGRREPIQLEGEDK